MNTGADISALYREFTDALTEVLAESAGGLARRGRLARARAAVKKHPDYSEFWAFCGSRKRIQKLGSPTKRRSLNRDRWFRHTDVHCSLPAAFSASRSRPTSLLPFCCQRSSEVHDWPNEFAAPLISVTSICMHLDDR